jgi:hypothetical protein
MEDAYGRVTIPFLISLLKTPIIGWLSMVGWLRLMHMETRSGTQHTEKQETTMSKRWLWHPTEDTRWRAMQ